MHVRTHALIHDQVSKELEEQKTENGNLQDHLKLVQTRLDEDTRKNLVVVAKLQTQLKEKHGGTKRKVCGVEETV